MKQTKSKKRPKATTSRHETPATSARAKWSVEQERVLLKPYLEARNNPAYKSDKGVKGKDWTSVVSQLNEKFGAPSIKASRSAQWVYACGLRELMDTVLLGQYKSNVDGIMKDYDVVKVATGLSGQGACSVTRTMTTDGDCWKKLYEGKPDKVMAKLKLTTFRNEGFEHYAICSLVAGMYTIFAVLPPSNARKFYRRFASDWKLRD